MARKSKLPVKPLKHPLNERVKWLERHIVSLEKRHEVACIKLDTTITKLNALRADFETLKKNLHGGLKSADSMRMDILDQAYSGHHHQINEINVKLSHRIGELERALTMPKKPQFASPTSCRPGEWIIVNLGRESLWRRFKAWLMCD